MERSSPDPPAGLRPPGAEVGAGASRASIEELEPKGSSLAKGSEALDPKGSALEPKGSSSSAGAGACCCCGDEKEALRCAVLAMCCACEVGACGGGANAVMGALTGADPDGLRAPDAAGLANTVPEPNECMPIVSPNTSTDDEEVL